MSEEYNGTWPGGGAGTQTFKDGCTMLSKNLDSFKIDSRFIGHIGNDTQSLEYALKKFYYLKDKMPELFSSDTLKRFQENDKIGGAPVFEIEGIHLSTGTLTFMHHLFQIQRFPNIKTIVEIGSGYGGQSKIIQDFMEVEYTCIDLPETLGLAEAYLTEVDNPARPTFIKSTEVPSLSPDLVISNYCLSELDETGMDFYMDRIIKNATYFYGACGHFETRINTKTHPHMIERLKEFFEVTVDKEHACPSNAMVVGIKK